MGRLVPENEQSSYEGELQSLFERKEVEGEIGIDSLTHSENEELEEVKDSRVLLVRPQQMIP